MPGDIARPGTGEHAESWSNRGTLIDDYELLLELGEGGMGKVFIAKHVQQSDLVALKIAKLDPLDVAVSAIFLREIRTASDLRHRHIVPIYTSGTAADGRLYLVMPLLEGGTLADPSNRDKFRDARRALTLLIQLTRAVQFAHERLILHCDLKPANILLDSDGEPRVSDFGLARVIGKPGSDYRGAVQGGTIGWMSPEQEGRRDLTAASDVFGLGMILRWLLAEDGPAAGSDPAAVKRRGSRRLRWELQTIARKATQVDPLLRYQSAAELACELERSRDGFIIQAERHLPWRRTTKWVRRHRLATAAGLQGILLLLYVALMPFSVLREVRHTIQQQNASIAVAQAGAVMNELRAVAARLEIAAVAPAVRELINHPDVYTPPPALAERSAGFDNLAVFTLSGHLRARYPRPPSRYDTLEFGYRDYFRTLDQLNWRSPGARSVAYVARVLYSRVDGCLHTGFAAPLFDERDQPVGVLLGTTLVRSTFGAVQMNAGNGESMTALLGSRDRDGPGKALPDTINVVAEPGLTAGQDAALDTATSKSICSALGCTPRLHAQFDLPSRAKALIVEDYVDPVSHTRSIAALAPVGGTGLVAVVATADGAADALTHRMLDRMKAFLWIPIAPGLLLLAGLGTGPLLSFRRARRDRRRLGPRRPSA